MENIYEQNKQFIKNYKLLSEVFIKDFYSLADEFKKYNHYRHRLTKAGWLPHLLTPFDLLQKTGSEYDYLTLEKFYLENWNDIKILFRKNIDSIKVDDLTNSVFNQSLESHENKFYTLVTRSLFPEIERVARIKLYEHNISKGISSLKDVREFIEYNNLKNYGLGEFWNIVILKEFKNIYNPIKTNNDVIKANINTIPNRHAAIHGHVNYNNICSSINSLIIAEYAFAMIEMIKV
jgi:hypothetical protein